MESSDGALEAVFFVNNKSFVSAPNKFVYSCHVKDLLFMNLILLLYRKVYMIELLRFADSLTRRTPCLTVSLNTQDTDLWDFFLGKELPVTEEKVSVVL
jgi:hypothetical protein